MVDLRDIRVSSGQDIYSQAIFLELGDVRLVSRCCRVGYL